MGRIGGMYAPEGLRSTHPSRCSSRAGSLRVLIEKRRRTLGTRWREKFGKIIRVKVCREKSCEMPGKACRGAKRRTTEKGQSGFV